MPFTPEQKAAYNREWKERQKTGEVKSTRYDTGECPVCGSRVLVTRDGKVMGHRPRDLVFAIDRKPGNYCRGVQKHALEVKPRA